MKRLGGHWMIWALCFKSGQPTPYFHYMKRDAVKHLNELQMEHLEVRKCWVTHYPPSDKDVA